MVFFGFFRSAVERLYDGDLPMSIDEPIFATQQGIFCH